jgi:hypothetical protein
METKTDPGQVILDRIAAREAERARLEAETAADMLAFSDLRRRESERHKDPMLRELEAGFAADELSLVVKEPTRTVQCRLADARRVRGRLPLTWEAFGAGRIDAQRIRLIASAVDKLIDNYAIIELDYWVVEYAATHTASQLQAWLRRFVARNAPDSRAARAEREKRSVWLSHQDDGMTFLSAYIPTPDAIRLDAELTRLAKAEPSDGRTLDQKRADAFARGMLGDGSSAQATIGVLVPVTSLAGLDQEPGTSFDGRFALPAPLVRDLAAEPGTLFYRVFTDPLGRILDVTELGRFPSRRLKVAIDIRDGTCRFATCSRPATECDDDHVIPHPRGPTNGENIRSLCRRHHRMKTHLGQQSVDLHVRVLDESLAA